MVSNFFWPYIYFQVLYAHGLWGKNVFISFSTPLRAAYAFPTIVTQTINLTADTPPYWGEAFLLRNMARQKKDVPVRVTVYNQIRLGQNEL